MKVFAVIAAAGLLAWLAWFLASPRDGESSPEAPPVTVVSDPPTTSTTDATAVFQRAFWRRPGENDSILHAERREWAGPDGVDRWQWFIAVKPSPELTKYLLDQNPFSLSEPAGTVSLPANQAPEWFPKSAASYKVRHSADGGMLLMMDSSGERLYATGQGHGFSKAVEMQRAQSTEIGTRIGRLPDSPPPVTPEN